MPDIFNYIDYRKFLAEYYALLKAQDAKYSHRYISMKVGYRSTGFFSEVVSGKKNLTGAVLLKLVRFLKLKKEEEEYFINLVHFNQAVTVDEKSHYYEKLMGVARVKVDILETDKFEYFSKWYYAAVRELLTFHAFKGDFRALARKLNPPINQIQARQAVQLLLDMGMLKVDEAGCYRPTAAQISTGEGFSSLNVAKFQSAFLELAMQGIDRHRREERDYSTLTLPMAREDLPRARLALTKLRSYLMAISDKCKDPELVYHFNFQIFPVSKP